MRVSAALAFRLRWGRAPPPSLEHGIDEFEDGALIGGGEPLDALEALEESRGLRRRLLPHGRHAERSSVETVRGREIDEHGARRLGVVGLVVGDDAIGDADRGAQLEPDQSPGLAQRSEAGTESFQRALLHELLSVR